MTDNEPERKLDWRAALPAMPLIVGIVFVLLSLFWPNGASQSSWSPEQAKKYQSASVELHGLSHSMAHAKPDEQAALNKKLQQAEADYKAIRSQLDSAIDRPGRISVVLRWTGIALMAIGGLTLYLMRNSATE
jgi:hypothetical protein